MVSTFEEDQSQYDTQPVQSDFEQKFHATTIEVVPAESSVAVTRALYEKLGEKAQSFSLNPNNIDYDSGRFVAQEWGGVMTLHGENEDSDTQLSILMGKDNGIVGYGAFTRQEDDSEQVAFKVFSEFRQGAHATSSRQVFEDMAFTHLSTSLDTPARLKVPRGQQYNPKVEGKPTNAPILYRKAGFRARTDEMLPPNLKTKLDAAMNNQKVEFSDNELIALSSQPLEMPIDNLGTSRDTIARVKQRSIGNIAPIGQESAQILASSVNVVKPDNKPVDKSGLNRLRDKLASV